MSGLRPLVAVARSPVACAANCFILSATVLLFSTAMLQAVPPLCGVNVGQPVAGGSVVFNSAMADDIASSGCRLVRVNFRIDGNATWTAANLANYDTVIQNARSRGIQVLGLICYEAVSGSQAEWNTNYNTTGINSYTPKFVDNAWLLINRYKNDVKLFEIWNEPNCWSVDPNSNPLNPGGFYIWPKNYANLLAETYKKCLTSGGSSFFTANGISLVSGGLFAHEIGGSFSTARDYMTNVYGQTAVWDAFQAVAGRRYPWDYFGYHFYLDQGSAVSTTKLANYFNDIRSLKMTKNDAASKFLVTEFGWQSSAIGDALQAANLRDTYNWMRAQTDITSGLWYQWNNNDGSFGLVYSIGNHKPSYTAFAAQCALTAAPTADFVAAPLTGVAPLVVQFTDRSTGSVTSWLWSFGDGGTSTQANPTHTYQLPGGYNIALTVAGPGGNNTLTRTQYVIAQAPLVPGDFDGNGWVDDVDVQRFIACFTGSQETTVPAGCGAGTAIAPPSVTWSSAANVAGLPAAISATDLLAGVTGVVEAGGFHSATPGGSAGGLADLTDGVAGTGVEAVLADYPGSADPLNRALQVRYDLASPASIQKIRVFAANTDGRVFQDYDVQYRASGDGTFKSLATSVTTGSFGRINAAPGAIGATLTEVAGANSQPMALDVNSLRFVFYPVSDAAAVFLDAYNVGEIGDTDGHAEAYVSSIVKEIDVFAFQGSPAEANVADLDGDNDVDQADFAILQRCLSGTNILADPGCAAASAN